MIPGSCWLGVASALVGPHALSDSEHAARAIGTGPSDFGNFWPGVPETSHVGAYPRALTVVGASMPFVDPLQISGFPHGSRPKLA